MNAKLKNEIETNSKNLRNPNIQKQFKDYYFDKDKFKNTGKTASTAASKS
jgi:hypothetical protein